MVSLCEPPCSDDTALTVLGASSPMLVSIRYLDRLADSCRPCIDSLSNPLRHSFTDVYWIWQVYVCVASRAVIGGVYRRTWIGIEPRELAVDTLLYVS
jgi:hypothetical protein